MIVKVWFMPCLACKSFKSRSKFRQCNCFPSVLLLFVHMCYSPLPSCSATPSCSIKTSSRTPAFPLIILVHLWPWLQSLKETLSKPGTMLSRGRLLWWWCSVGLGVCRFASVVVVLFFGCCFFKLVFYLIFCCSVSSHLKKRNKIW